MISVYQLKPAFQGLLRPLVSGLALRGVSANQVTLAALFLSCIQGLAMVLWSGWPLLLLPLVLLLRMGLNAIDGMLAREHDMKTPLGAILNELGDVLSDTALYLPLALVPGISATAMVILVVLAIVTETAGICGVQIGSERRYDGPMGKSDRALVFGSLGLILGLGAASGLWLDAVLWLVILLTMITIYNRVRSALKEVSA